MSEHGYTIDGEHAARMVRTLRNIARMVTETDPRGRLTDDQMMVLTGGHAVAGNRLQVAANMVDTANVIASQMTDDDPYLEPFRLD